MVNADSDLRETNLSTQRVFDGLLLHIDHLVNRLPDGSTAAREVARHVGAAAVLPVDRQGNVVLVRQYRSPFDRILLEIPAGKLDAPGEDRLQAARRELSEETGLSAARWDRLTTLMTTVGFSDETIDLFLARDLTEGEAHPDADEHLHVVRMPFREALQRVFSGEIQDSKTVCALLMAQNVLNGGDTRC